jgi:hypothetical protein
MQAATKTNEDLSCDNVTINDDVIIRHNNNEIHRIVSISNSLKKTYYFMTDPIQPGYCKLNVTNKTSSMGQKYTRYNFVIKSKISIRKNDENKNEQQQIEQQDIEQQDIGQQETEQQENGQHEIGQQETEQHENGQQEIGQQEIEQQKIELSQERIIKECIEAKNFIDKLNQFKRGLTNRVRYRMMIPQNYPDQTLYYVSAKTIKLNNEIKLKNIIEYQNFKNNFSSRIVSNILRNCKCKLLFRIDSFTVTHTNVYLDICLVRIFPENFDALRANDKTYVLSELNSLTTKNINTYNKLNNIKNVHGKTKQEVQKELMKTLSFQKHK